LSGLLSSGLLFLWYGYAIPWWAWLEVTPVLPVLIFLGFPRPKYGRGIQAAASLIINVPLALVTALIAGLAKEPTGWIVWTVMSSLFTVFINSSEPDTAEKRG
jgi:hypothetical protein